MVRKRNVITNGHLCCSVQRLSIGLIIPSISAVVDILSRLHYSEKSFFCIYLLISFCFFASLIFKPFLCMDNNYSIKIINNLRMLYTYKIKNWRVPLLPAKFFHNFTVHRLNYFVNLRSYWHTFTSWLFLVTSFFSVYHWFSPWKLFHVPWELVGNRV